MGLTVELSSLLLDVVQRTHKGQNSQIRHDINLKYMFLLFISLLYLNLVSNYEPSALGRNYMTSVSLGLRRNRLK